MSELIDSKAAIGNLANHKFSEKMVTLKIPQKVLDVACHDTQFSVQESALNVLSLFCKYEKARKVSQQNRSQAFQETEFNFLQLKFATLDA